MKEIDKESLKIDISNFSNITKVLPVNVVISDKAINILKLQAFSLGLL